MNLNRKIIGDRLKMLRHDCNISQEQLALNLHLSRSTISKIEAEGRISSLEALIQLSEYYHVSTDYILKGSSITTSISEELQTIISLLSALVRRL